uniref:Putative rrna adenine n-6-methyltransferase n=1 Tax=Ornithodoros turicata TaxID=34597 RepID=A0A2R5L8G1_9ACAR
MRGLLRTASDASDVEKYATLLVKFLSEYRWLTDAYVLDYFVENHWQKLPSSWQNVLKDIELDYLSQLLETASHFRPRAIWPLSLLCTIRVAKLSALTRKPVSSPDEIPEFSTKHCARPLHESNDRLGSFEPSENLSHAFRKHVKPKKQHEISRLGKIVHLLSCKSNSKHVLDVGAGHGHLARLLALGYGLKVSTVDVVGSHQSAANRFDDQAALHVQKADRRVGITSHPSTSTISGELPKHFTLELSKATTRADLEQFTRSSWSHRGEDHPFVLVGLHSCGDLGPSVLRLFAQVPTCRAVALVGCCYMKMTDDGGKPQVQEAIRKPAKLVQTAVRPLSRFVVQASREGLSYEAREVACHALEAYIKKLRDDPSSLKIHCYRALLEKVIVKRYPDYRHVPLGGVKHAANMTFSEYAEKALEKFPLQVCDIQVDNPVLEEAMKDWKKVITFYSLRLLLAPAIESLILTDRMLYLWEQGISSCLVPLFDPSLSPRNHVLLAIKQ